MGLWVTGGLCVAVIRPAYLYHEHTSLPAHPASTTKTQQVASHNHQSFLYQATYLPSSFAFHLPQTTFTPHYLSPRSLALFFFSISTSIPSLYTQTHLSPLARIPTTLPQPLHCPIPSDSIKPRINKELGTDLTTQLTQTTSNRASFTPGQSRSFYKNPIRAVDPQTRSHIADLSTGNPLHIPRVATTNIRHLGKAHANDTMDDKTSSNLRPSTGFADDSFASTSHSHFRTPLTSSTYLSTTNRTILPGINQIVSMEHKRPFTPLKAMLSPPEQTPHDSFSRRLSNPSMDLSMKPLLPNSHGRVHAPLSPPISPETRLIGTAEETSTTVGQDMILYPHQGSPASQPSLFADTDTHRLVDEHVAARESSVFREVSPPRTSEYELVLEFKSQVLKEFNANRRLWQQRELAQLREDNSLKSGRRYTTIAPAGPGVRPIRQFPPKSTVRSGVSKAIKAPRAPKVVTGGRGTTPSGEGKKVAREDKDFNSLPDYCPPTSTLPNKPNSLKVDWKGAPIDLKTDEHAHLLHPDELALAANLRLDCATYLTSKRRIFIKRLDAYRIGKEFRKTDAQQACKIDVNKASKLWQAFDKVHWLDPQWISKFAR